MMAPNSALDPSGSNSTNALLERQERTPYREKRAADQCRAHHSLLSETYPCSTHNKRIGETTPCPLPAGNQLLQDLGLLAFALDQVEIVTPTKKPRSPALTRAQKGVNPRVSRHRVSIEPVNTSAKRRRTFHDNNPLRKADGRELVMEVCYALRNFHVPLTLRQPIVQSR
jgi:hypothetical protein